MGLSRPGRNYSVRVAKSGPYPVHGPLGVVGRPCLSQPNRQFGCDLPNSPAE